MPTKMMRNDDLGGSRNHQSGASYTTVIDMSKGACLLESRRLRHGEEYSIIVKDDAGGRSDNTVLSWEDRSMEGLEIVHLRDSSRST